VKTLHVFSAVVLAVSAVLTGCVEGYSTRDGVQLNNAMSAEESIEALAMLAEESASQGTYAFTLNPDCVLTVQRLRWLLLKSTQQVNLREVTFDLRDNGQEFDLMASAKDLTGQQVVIEALPLLTSQHGLWLLRYMARSCTP
jgi:type II secretory pathway component PulK